MILGTPVYMSPEQCRGQDEDDHRTDLYSLGCILCEMLSGEPPYGRGPTDMLFAAHQVAPIPDLAAPGDVPRELAQLVRRLLAKQPEGRPHSALEVVAVLGRWLAGCGRTRRAPRGSRGSIRVALASRANRRREPTIRAAS
jgi:serine/threonine-protein kinase